jgi:hypothetical protein
LISNLTDVDDSKVSNSSEKLQSQKFRCIEDLPINFKTLVQITSLNAHNFDQALNIHCNVKVSLCQLPAAGHPIYPKHICTTEIFFG